ncbi:3,4-dihydroxy-2-butanone-4-phosphate synthase [Parerythrobacter lacustris]|uniref:3,4-dihydroxy-2-butanone 4-phosphate synthase n=1 Tax=Parerythrobacter lacustris TaxID=2969984 RepID=A0ABT1XU82_9SPHN|nr:3,4-dihydroxy-2-butanone-4-phosphate synthase [Parerythrobacter lacustris]MCR2835176.1 3,4-dihydroxy-2-butanone-4-phosphate synthase [Parerythrobacter lacustris]
MSSLDPTLDALKRGEIVVLTGDRLRGGDIDFCTPASMVTPDKINFMATHGRGLICLTLTSEAAMRLGISLMNPTSERQTERPFGNSIEAAEGVTTGISAADRAHTILVAVAEGARADHLVSPGHVFPLIARSGGVEERMSAVEGSIDLCRRAGVGEAAVICSIMRDDGEMARIDDIADLIDGHGLAVCDISLLSSMAG